MADDPRFVRWCPACDWNVDPLGADSPGWLGGILRRWQDQAAERLFRHAAGRHRRRITQVATLAVAAIVHTITLALPVAAGYLLLAADGVWVFFRWAGALLLLGLFVSVQPFILRRRREPTIELDERAAPALLKLIADVSHAVRTTPVQHVVVSGAFNASSLKLKWRRPALEIGLPLWVSLNDRERVALLGHEMAHRVNGDLRDGAFVHYALVTLSLWAFLFQRPLGLSGSAAEMLVPLVLAPFSILIAIVGTTLQMLSWRQGQRAEYYADELATRVGSSSAMAGLLAKLLLAPAIEREVGRIIRFQPDAAVWDDVRTYADGLPRTELERLRRVAVRRLQRIDTTHPPTFYRLERVQALGALDASVVVSDVQMRDVDRELAAKGNAVVDSLKDAYHVW